MAETKSGGRGGGGRGAAGTRTAERVESSVESATPNTGGGQQRTATLNLPFVTAQFRAPNVRMPGRSDVDAAARGARSMLPSPRAGLYYGALALTAAVGVIEWPVAAAIGVGTALASRGEANPEPRGRGAGGNESPERG